MELRRVVGPPGAGKTTFVARQCRRAAEKYGSEGALVCSLTQAAAREAGGRETGLEPKMVATLHAHCYRALRLGKEDVVDGTAVEAWNKDHPELELSGGGDETDDLGGRVAKTRGDMLRQELDVLRARMTPREMWPVQVRHFGERWEAFKSAAGLADYTDFIERAIVEVPLPPHSPAVIFVDEAQDLSRLELELLKRWMAHVEHVVLVGDPYQALYGWRGADPDVMSGEIFAVLEQSYRVPRAVRDRAMQAISRSQNFVPIEYRPTEEEGVVRHSGATYKQPEALLGDLLNRDRSIMVLAPCAYMLEPTCTLLRRWGIPYHNPYAEKRWNPLRTSKTSTVARLLAFLRCATADDFRLFVPLLKSCDADGSGVLVRGGKKAIDQLADDTSEAEAAVAIRGAFKPEALPFLRRGDGVDLGRAVDWFEANLLPTKQSAARYPIAIWRRYGTDGLTEAPKVVVGTCHSVKGGEAATVVVWPDISVSGFNQYQRPGWHGRDAFRRLFYVAYTRAQHELVLGAPSGGLYALV